MDTIHGLAGEELGSETDSDHEEEEEEGEDNIEGEDDDDEEAEDEDEEDEDEDEDEDDDEEDEDDEDDDEEGGEGMLGVEMVSSVAVQVILSLSSRRRAFWLSMRNLSFGDRSLPTSPYALRVSVISSHLNL